MTTPAQTRQAAGQPNGNPTTASTQSCPRTVKIIITVQRLYNYHDRGTPGTLEARIEGEAVRVSGRTTEQPPGRRNLGHGAGLKNYPIPAGTYDAFLRTTSSRNGALPRPYTNHAVQLNNVPNFEGVQIHTGQFPRHSAGCIILAATSNGNENIANGNLMGDSVPKNKELVEFIEQTQAQYGRANVTIQVIVNDPPAGAQPPPLPPPPPPPAPRARRR